jgi:hypothetical protein
MPFIRVKWIKGVAYYYLVESFREDRKVRQRVLAYLGEHNSLESAHAYWCGQAKTTKNTATKQHAREMVKKLKQYL